MSFMNIVARWMRRLFRRDEIPRGGPGALLREWPLFPDGPMLPVETWARNGRETERTFDYHGMNEHEWEELER
jgi:hypothetical protein